MDKAVQDFLQCKRIAVVGVSHDSKKFGNIIYKELGQRDYEVFGVNPNLNEINGAPCYPNLAALQGKVDGVIICVKPAAVPNVLREAAQSGVSKVWLQRGCESPEALETARSLNLQAVAGKCILMYAEPVSSMHGFHRFFVKLFGNL